jgi:hypothetical protein
VPSSHQFADIMTKGLPSALFNEFRFSLMRSAGSNIDCKGGGG